MSLTSQRGRLGYSAAFVLTLIAFAVGLYLSPIQGPFHRTATVTGTRTSISVITIVGTSTTTVSTTSTSIETSTTTTTSETLIINVATTTSTTTVTHDTNVTTTFIVSAPAVEMVVSPTSGTPNQSITVAGNGLKPNVGVGPALGIVSVSNITTGQDGTFSTSFSVPNVPAGTYLLTANASGTNSVSFKVTALLAASPASGTPNSPATAAVRGLASSIVVAQSLSKMWKRSEVSKHVM